MTRLQILGPGCPKCDKLAENVRAAADAVGIDYQLEKVTGIQQILAFGVMMTPALVVDGEVKLVGKVPGVEELMQLLR
jgi:small redox-active disulfide protein 2